MSFFPSYKAVLIITFTITLTLQLRSTSSASWPLSPGFYQKACPNLLATVRVLVEAAIDTESRMGASLLRLHFHDCFVKGCDGSILLNDTPKQKGEKTAGPNKNSVRGFEVIDGIKSAVEKICPNRVSCADILAIAARDSVVRLGGISWEVELGRRDSKTASLKAANINLPSPSSNLSTLLSSFESKGLSLTDLVALSGAHTIGLARCSVFKNRLYNETNINSDLKKKLSSTCLKSSTKGDNKLASLDNLTPNKFDNSYYAGLVTNQGLLTSDQQLFSVEGQAAWQVWMYNANEPDFFNDFANGMVNMGGISPLTGKGNGEIRTECWRVNGQTDRL